MLPPRLAFALFFCLLPSALFAQSKTGSAAETIFDKMLHSTVFVLTPIPDQPNRAATGSGSLIGTVPKSGNAVIITNYHVVAPSLGRGGNREVRIMFPVRNAKGDLDQNRQHYLQSTDDPTYLFRGKVLAIQKSKDLALVELFVDAARGQQLPRGSHVVPLAGNSPKPSSSVHTLGNTGAGGMWNYTQGFVRSVVDDRQFVIELPSEGRVEINARVIETTNATNRGDSGGPLVNDAGELVGITQSGATNANSLSVFIDIQEVKTLLRDNKITVPKRVMTAQSAPAQTAPPRTESVASKPSTPPVDPRELEAESKLRNARRAIARDKDYGLAESFVKDILSDYSDTKAAAEAKSLLEEIKKKK
jgi:S1-C subfamily serine protease